MGDVNECANQFGATCGEPRAEFIVNSRASWNSGPWGASALVRYLSSVDDDRIVNFDVDPSTLAAPDVGAEFYVDISGSYRPNDQWSFNFGIKNLFDNEPDIVGLSQSEQANTFPETYDLLGTRFFFNVDWKFR